MQIHQGEGDGLTSAAGENLQSPYSLQNASHLLLFFRVGPQKKEHVKKIKLFLWTFFWGEGEGLFWFLFREDSELLSTVTNLAIIKYTVK